MKANYFNLQEQPKVLKTGKINQKTRKVQRDIKDKEDLEEMLKCLQRNSATGACPNAAKGIFVNLEQARDFLKHP